MPDKSDIKTQLEHVQYSRDVVHNYSKAIQRSLDMAIDFIPYCNREYKKGRPVIWTTAFATDPVICYGAGALPASITEIGRIASKDAVIAAEDHFMVPNETCSMVKADLGEFYLRKGEISNRLYYASKNCEPYNEAFELLKDYGYDIHLMDVGFRSPGMTEERQADMKAHYRKEIIKAIEWISGKKPDLDAIHEEQVYYNKMKKKIDRFLDLRVKHPTYIKSLPTTLFLIGNNHYYGNRELYEEILDQLIEELEGLSDGDFCDAKAFLTWAGLRGQEFNIFEAIDDAKGAILSWQMPNNLVEEYDLNIDPIDAIVEFEMNDLFTGTVESTCESIYESVKKYGITGILLYGVVGCSVATVDIELKRKYFADRGIHALSLIGAYEVGGISGQVSTRVSAFVEMLSGKEAHYEA